MSVRALYVLEHQWARHRAMLASTVIQSLLAPVAYLGAMGLGLGSLIDERTDPAVLGAPSYASFVAPALVVAANMLSGIGLTAWPVLGALRWERTFHAIVSTPARVIDLVAGFLSWLGLRMALTGTAFVVAMIALDATHSPGVVFVPIVAALTGLAFAAPMAAFSATQETDAAFPVIIRFAIIPLFLLGGVFFPVDDLPAAVAWIVRVTPLWHGVATCRDLSLGDAAVVPTLLRVAYISAFVVAGALAMRRTLTRRLSR